MKKPENLDAAGNERERLEEALGLNKPLTKAYSMREDNPLSWNLPGKIAAEAHLERAQSLVATIPSPPATGGNQQQD